MISLFLAAGLWLGPPVLPDLPAERAAKARADEQARLEAEAEAKAEADAKAEAKAEAQRNAPQAQQPQPTSPSTGPTQGAVAPTAPQRPQKPQSKPVTAGQLRAAAPQAQLEAASASELAAWAEDDALYGSQGEPDDALRRPPSKPSGRHAPTRTATRLRTSTALEQPSRPPPPTRSAAFVFGYRIFNTSDAFARAQSWHVGSLEVTPVRRWVRLNLITEVGAEGGAAARGGDRADLFMMQKAGLGVQSPGWLTPFVEFQGGAGVARVELFDRNDLLLLWTLGVDAGAQWAVTKWMWIHASVGWIRPTFQRPERAVYHDSFTFKLGLGF
ncbi:MAG: hypothetical protein ACRBN8_41490 [Nannocystales bacterium]